MIGKGIYGCVYFGMNVIIGEFLVVKEVEVNFKVVSGDKVKMWELVVVLD